MRGFSLVELIISFAVLGILAGVSLPYFESVQTNSDLDTAIDSVAQHLRRAQALAQASRNDSRWGVKIAVGTLTVFQGGNYATRDATKDEVTSLPRSITPSGMTEIVFFKLTGLPWAVGAVILTSSNGSQRYLSLNAHGTVLYD